MRVQFLTYRPGKVVLPQGEHNDGVPHPDYNPDCITSIMDYYIRFAADPEFRVSLVKAGYDIDNPKLVDALLDSDEPEFGEQDLEYMHSLQREFENKQPVGSDNAQPKDDEIVP